MKLETLRKRNEFLRVRGGGRCSTHAFVLEAKQRTQTTGNQHCFNSGPRFGFTVTKKLGNAVRRNRIRRRLRAALQMVAMQAAKNHFDYVLIARAAAYDMPFRDLSELMTKAFERAHQPGSGRRRDRGKKAGNKADAKKTDREPSNPMKINPKT